ncbi:hypothetical protein [Clostridium sp. KNHs214]|uniref:hypothetical protein n=1 Tax=Clostridium sp. KNHs214 TaxID=1540257 RepID=UPI000A9AEB7C|nr:hypothetical protein [Clostridium sp. KNHs214]
MSTFVHFFRTSRKRVQVQNPSQFSRIVTDKLYKEGKISIQMRKNEQVFTLKQNPQKAYIET